MLTLLLYVVFVKVTLFFNGKSLATTEESVLFFMYKSATLISVCFILYLFYDRKWRETFSRHLISIVEWKFILKGLGLIAAINIGFFLVLLVTGHSLINLKTNVLLLICSHMGLYGNFLQWYL